MSVLNRPLFRQAGGPAQPMPQDMAPPAAPPGPPPQQIAELERVNAMANQEGQAIGAQYAQDMMRNVETAESTEDLINAMRGNELPMEARVEELGALVGMEDAQATPESVLALVQPVMMMTEEGAMNSGIGELMQGLIGDAEMAGDMEGGVGSLMMAGAPEAPAPQNFRCGGEVKHLAEGGSAIQDLFSDLIGEEQTLRAYYDQNLEDYREILGETEEEAERQRGLGWLDIAQGGLQLAAGVPNAGGSFVSQFAGAAMPVAESLKKRGLESSKRDRLIRTAALEAAARERTDDKKARSATRLALAKELSSMLGDPGKSQVERERRYVTSRLNAYADGTLSPEETANVNSILASTYKPNITETEKWDQSQNRYITSQSVIPAAIPDVIRDAISNRSSQGLSTPGIPLPETQTTDQGPQVEEAISIESTGLPTFDEVREEYGVEPTALSQRLIEQRGDLADVFGPKGFFTSGTNTLAGAMGLGPAYAGSQSVNATLETLNESAITALTSSREGKAGVDERNEFRKNIPELNAFATSPEKALQQVQAMVARLKDDLRETITNLQSPAIRRDPKASQNLAQKRNDLRNSLANWSVLADLLENDINPSRGSSTLQDIEEIKSGNAGAPLSGDEVYQTFIDASTQQ